jgi:hypothetical protein
MFSMKIVDSDAFLDMPQSSQNLYFHLAMRADDEGFIGNPKKIVRMTGASDDDYKILIAKRFVLVFPSGICVIKHWFIHNYIAKDRYNETVYTDEKSLINTKENGAYTECIQNVVHSDDTGKVRLGKVRLVEKREGATPVELPDWLDKDLWNTWVKFRKEKGSPLKQSTIVFQLKFLSQNKSEYKEIIEISLRNGWTGLFPLKGSKKPTNVIVDEHSKEIVKKMEANKK